MFCRRYYTSCHQGEIRRVYLHRQATRTDPTVYNACRMYPCAACVRILTYRETHSRLTPVCASPCGVWLNERPHSGGFAPSCTQYLRTGLPWHCAWGSIHQTDQNSGVICTSLLHTSTASRAVLTTNSLLSFVSWLIAKASLRQYVSSVR